MIEVLVYLNGLEFTIRVPGNVYDGDQPDYNAAVAAALVAYHIDYPLDPLDIASLEVRIVRVHTDVAARDGEGVDVNHPVFEPEYLSEDELEELTAPEPDDDPDPCDD